MPWDFEQVVSIFTRTHILKIQGMFSLARSRTSFLSFTWRWKVSTVCIRLFRSAVYLNNQQWWWSTRYVCNSLESLSLYHTSSGKRPYSLDALPLKQRWKQQCNNASWNAIYLELLKFQITAFYNQYFALFSHSTPAAENLTSIIHTSKSLKCT